MKRSIILIKISFLLLAVHCSLFTAVAQSPGWLWAKSAEKNAEECIALGASTATDASGNVYVTGYFESSTITFGNDTLTNAGYTNIFLVKYDGAGNVLWAKSAGGSLDDYSTSVATDASGNVYLTGYFSSYTISIGNYSLTNGGDVNLFLAKFDATGNALWAKSEGGFGSWGYSVTIGASGNIYLAGSFVSSYFSDADIFIAKCDSSGNVLWTKGSDGGTDAGGYGIATDGNENVYVTGSFESSKIIFGNDTLTNAGNTNIFLTKYDSSGNVLWAKSVGGSNGDQGNSVATDASGNLYLTGCFTSSTISFGSYTLANAGNEDIFLAKYDSSGNALWAKSAGGSNNDEGNSVATDASGDVYLTGNFASSTISFGSYTLTNAGNSNIFLAKYDGASNVLWAKSVGGNDDGISVTTDASGDVYLTGTFADTIIFGNDTLTNFGNDDDIFLAKLGLGNSTGLNELIYRNEKIIIYPNPSSDNIAIETKSPGENSTLSIYNIEGQLLLQQALQQLKTEINISSFAKDIYILKIENEEGIAVRKIVKE